MWFVLVYTKVKEREGQQQGRLGVGGGDGRCERSEQAID